MRIHETQTTFSVKVLMLTAGESLLPMHKELKNLGEGLSLLYDVTIRTYSLCRTLTAGERHCEE